MHMQKHWPAPEGHWVKIAVPSGNLSRTIVPAIKQIATEVLEAPGRDGLFACGFLGNWMEVAFYLRDRRMIPRLVSEGTFDAGITGLDLVDENNFPRKRILGMFAKPVTQWFVAGPKGWWPPGYKKIRVGAELHRVFAKKVLFRAGLYSYSLVPIEGFEECAIADGLCDAILVVVETGRALRELGLEVPSSCPLLFESRPVLITKETVSLWTADALRALKDALKLE